MLKAGLIAPADKCPYDPLALDDLEPLTKTKELGEYLMELISKESE